MIQKPGKDSKIPTSYLPISHLNTMSKLYEKLLLNYLYIFIIPKLQGSNMALGPIVAPRFNLLM